METLLIIDGNNLLFQMFFGMPSKVCVVFDYDGSNDRKEEYRNNRFTDWDSLPQDEVPFFEE